MAQTGDRSYRIIQLDMLYITLQANYQFDQI